jgi:hypothetical protein
MRVNNSGFLPATYFSCDLSGRINTPKVLQTTEVYFNVWREK